MTKSLKIKKKPTTARFADSFHTMMENIGATRRDVTSRYNGFFRQEEVIQYDELNAIYQSVPIIRRAIELITGHILKNGVSFTIPDEPEATAEVVELAERVNINKLFEQTALYTLINGCGGVILVDKSQDPRKEVNLGRLKGKTPTFVVVDGRFITVSPDMDPLSPTFYEPKEIHVLGRTFHPSWVNAMSGLPVSQVLKPKYKYLGMSLIENAYQAIVNDEIMNRAIPNIVYRSSVVNYKITGMKDAIKSGEEDSILKYVSDAENAKSVLNATICDGEDAVEVISRELSGLEGLDERSQYRLGAAVGIAAVVLFGKAPDGMNASGNSDWENFYNYVEVWQKRWYGNLRWFYRILTACVTGRTDVNFELDFNKASLLSPQQKVANDTAVLQNAQMMRDMGMPEATISRYLIENEIITEDEAEEYAGTLEEMDQLSEQIEEAELVEADSAGEGPKLPVDEPKRLPGPRALKKGTKPIKAV